MGNQRKKNSNCLGEKYFKQQIDNLDNFKYFRQNIIPSLETHLDILDIV